jgi:hypothetical protein
MQKIIFLIVVKGLVKSGLKMYCFCNSSRGKTVKVARLKVSIIQEKAFTKTVDD